MKKWILYLVGIIVGAMALFIPIYGYEPIMFGFKNGFLSGILFKHNLNHSISQDSAMDFIGNLISGYSLFITAVIFLLGIPLAVYSFFSLKENKEFKKKFEDEYRADLNSIKESIKVDIDENNAYYKIDSYYNEDPENLKKGEGEKYLKEFSKCFVEKQTRETNRYFYAGLKYKQNKDRNINQVDKIKNLYKDNELQQLNIALEYFLMCEKKLPYKPEEENSRSSLYREIASTLKCLGLYYYHHNSILAIDHLLGALENFQKAVQADDKDVLPFNSKSNTLKDIFRLIKENENSKIKVLLFDKIKNKLKATSVCIFDLKAIAAFIEKDVPEGSRVCFENNTKFFNDLKKATEHCRNQECFECRCICDKCQLYLQNINNDILLNIILIESVICIKNKVLSDKHIDKLIGDNTKFNKEFKYWCYLTCAISYFMVFNYCKSRKDSSCNKTEENYWHNNFLDNLTNAIKAGCKSDKMTAEEFIIRHIKSDVDLKDYREEDDWENNLLKKVTRKKLTLQKVDSPPSYIKKIAIKLLKWDRKMFHRRKKNK